MPASKKIQGFMERASFIRKMFEEGNRRKAEFGAENVFDFSLGNPSLEPPKKFKEVLTELISDQSRGLHGYMSNAGYPETRQAVADFLSKESKLNFQADDIVMTVGAGGALNVVLKTILNPGEEVIIPSPYFVEYNFYLDNHQGEPVIVPTKPDFSLDLESISSKISEKTRAVLIDTPNNPTGKVYTEEDLNGLADLLRGGSQKIGQPIYLISDEPYRKIAYDNISVPSIFNAYSESFVVTSFSKDLSLAGERIGYAAIHPDISDRDMLIQGLVFCNRVIGFVNAPALMQRAVTRLLEESVDIAQYQKKRDMLYQGLISFGYEVSKPGGAFYLFPKSPIEDDVAFVDALRDENILTVPGSGFQGPGYFRIAYCVADETIEKALPGFERVIRKFK